MGHRSLVAYHQADGTFTLRYAHWGENLAAAIGAKTPLGGPADWPDWATVVERLDVDSHGGYEPSVATRVGPRPLADGLTADDVLAIVDASYESLVVVSPSFEATQYLVCSLDPSNPGQDLVFARPDGDPGALRSWFVEAKSQLSAVVASGDLPRETARAMLRRALGARVTLYSTDDASFLRGR